MVFWQKDLFWSMNTTWIKQISVNFFKYKRVLILIQNNLMFEIKKNTGELNTCSHYKRKCVCMKRLKRGQVIQNI